MSEQIIEVEAESLAEARKQMRYQLPEGFLLNSERVISDGKPKSVLGVANTAEEAFTQAQRKVPINAKVLRKKLLRTPQEQVIKVEASNEVNARVDALNRPDSDDNEILQSILLISTGKKGFLGVGATPNHYEAHFLQQAVVEITYETRAKISAKVGTSLEKSASMPKQAAQAVGPLIRKLLQRDEYYSAIWVQRIRTTAEALGEFGDPRAVEPLVEAAVTFDFTRVAQVEVQEAVAQALKKIGDPRAIDLLIARFKNEPSGSHALHAIEMLGRMGDPRAVEFLLDIRVANERKLLELSYESWGALQRAVIVALGKLGDKRAVELLISLLTDSRLAGQAAWALDLIGDPRAAEPLLALLKRGQFSITVAKTLVRMRDVRVVSLLMTELQDEQDNQPVAILLEEILEHHASDVASEDLRAIVQLKDRYHWRALITSSGNTELDAIYGQSTAVKECVAVYPYLRRLAQQELAHRDLEL